MASIHKLVLFLKIHTRRIHAYKDNFILRYESIERA